ncbi:MAG: ABC transporter ATP-binding protein [Rhodoferax sp.]
MDLHVAQGEIVALLGRNGCGRSTLAKALVGLEPSQGSIHWAGRSLQGVPAHQRAHMGLGYVPESRDVFPNLTVTQNLVLGEKPGPASVSQRASWTVQDCFALFPALAERKKVAGGVLSGGEQQMLSLARTLMGNPTLLILDEPTEGLAPMLAAQLASSFEVLRGRGIAVLLIEQKLSIALSIADRCLVMGHGRIVFEGSPASLTAESDIQRQWLSV